MAVSRSRRNAVEAFRLTLQQTVACVTPETLLVVQTPRNPDVLTATFPFQARGLVVLRGDQGEPRLRCSVDHSFLLDPAVVVHSTGYAYHLYDLGGTELLGYHWHPQGAGARPEAHLHVRATIGDAKLSRLHLPTGRVALEAFVRLMITEFGIAPLQADWRRLLDTAERAFVAARTWA